MQQEAFARSGDDELRATAFPSDYQPPTAKKITEPFDIRFPDLPSLVVEVRPRNQVELHVTYQVHPPKTCHNILSRAMSIRKNFENDHCGTKRKAETIEAEKIPPPKRKVVVQERKGCRRSSSR